MEKITLEKREELGRQNKKLIAEGYVPSVVYNSKGDSTNVKLSLSSASKIVREATSTTILDTDLDGKALKVVVKEIDTNALTDEIRHIAFFEIDKEKEMVFTIPFEITGISPAVKNNLGVLVDVLSSIDVKCKLDSLVPFIEIDVSKLEHPGQSIAVNDLNFPDGISLVNNDQATATIVTVTDLQKEEEIIVPEVEVEEGAEGIVPAEGEEVKAGEETTEEEKK